MFHACFTPIALCFVYTLWCFYAFSRTNILTRCHSASSCFLLFLYFKKVIQEILSKLDEIKAKVPIYLIRRRSPKERRSRARRRPHHRVARCNDPEKSSLLELLVIFFFASSWHLASSCIVNLACFVKLKIIWYKTILNFCSYVFIINPLFFSYFEFKSKTSIFANFAVCFESKKKIKFQSCLTSLIFPSHLSFFLFLSSLQFLDFRKNFLIRNRARAS
jgi:hypothetical protein